MPDDGTIDETLTDFAVAVSRDEGRWDVATLPRRSANDLDTLVTVLGQLPTGGGVLGLVSVGDDFFVAVLVRGDDVQLLLSDASAATEWALARDVLAELGVPVPEDGAEGGGAPVGDLDMLEDHGLSAMELNAICSDPDLYPDEMLGRIATRLGFGEEFEIAVAAAEG